MGSLVVVSLLFTLADSLEVTSYTLQNPGLRYRNVTLGCGFTSLESVKLEDIALRWRVKRGSSIHQVYKFDGHNATAERAGSFVDLALLPAGNASLYLSDLSLEDAGEYICTVFVSGEARSAALILKVAAQPAMSLSPMNPSLLVGESETFLCDLTGFYPEHLDIKWFKKIQDRELAMSENICTGLPFPEKSGTFRVSSQISAVFSIEDTGATMVCEVQHESLQWPLRENSIVTLMAKDKAHESPAVIAAVVVCTVLLAVMISVIFLLYQKFVAKVPPLVSHIILPEMNAAGEKMVAMCNIHGFRPRTIDISWYIGKSSEEKVGAASTNEALLTAEDVTKQAEHSLSKHGSVFSVTSQLAYTPCIQDDGATLMCVVNHKAMPRANRLEKAITVVARPTKMYITSLPLVPRLGEKLALSCIIEKFYPKSILVTWVRNKEVLSDITQYGPFPCDNDYYSVWSQVEFILSQEDDGANYSCQISHSSLGSPEELSFEINLKGLPPEVQFISAEPPDPVIGVETRFSCLISNFFPMDITVAWFRNGVEQEAGVCNSLCVQSSRGLYSMCSIMKYIPQARDQDTIFTCRVQHAALRNCQERSYTLTLLPH